MRRKNEIFQDTNGYPTKRNDYRTDWDWSPDLNQIKRMISR